jgi:SAM-dependent methyltransferase
MNVVKYNIDTYNYFKTFCDSIDNKTILDYGSNYGMFLKSSNGLFPKINYTGVDISLDAIKIGQHLYPEAKFIHYNGHNFMYNYSGEVDTKPVLDSTYDLVISYSVFTHTTVDDMLKTIDWLYKHLNAGGKILATWLDVDDYVSNNYFFQKRVKEFGYCDKIETDTYLYLVDNKISATPTDCKYLQLFFKKQYLAELLKDYNFKLADAPNVQGCFQSCLIISK